VLTEIGLSLVEHYRESSRRDADMLAQLEDFRLKLPAQNLIL
jgi:hypothetical protein